MPTKLRKLKITRVAVCPLGANPDADILLFKQADRLPADDPLAKQDLHAEPDGDEATPMDYATRMQQGDLWDDLWEKWYCFCDTFRGIIADGDDDNIPNLPILVTSIDQFSADVADLLTSTGVMTKAAPLLKTMGTLVKVGAVMTAQRKKRLQDAIAALQAILDEASPKASPGASLTTKGAEMAETLESITKRAEAAEAKLADVEKRATTAEARVQELEPQLVTVKTELATAQSALAKAKQTPEEQEAEYLASLPDTVRKKYEADQLEKVELRKQLQEEKDQRLQVEYIQKTAVYRALGVTPDDWHVLKAIDTLPEDVRTRLTMLFKALTEQLKTSTLFKSVGIEGGQGSMEEAPDAEGQILVLAKAHAAEQKCDLGTAIQAIGASHPELWHRYQVAKRQSNRV